ncbi:low affinity iron permease family protein [Mesorhizobium sp. L2C084A000]|uniref:low affinity iron permease family protein n=1 Tax=unclassified Mesorhizobium TaxID=325217 RepID=UPI0032AE8887
MQRIYQAQPQVPKRLSKSPRRRYERLLNRTLGETIQIETVLDAGRHVEADAGHLESARCSTVPFVDSWRGDIMHRGNQGHCPEFFGMANHPVTSALTSIGTLTSRPAAFLVLLAYAILWMIFERQSLDWHGAATLFTWAMTLFIQRAEHRDTQAIHAKLDEILRSDHAASNITRIDDEEPEEIEKHRHRQQRGD